MLILSCQNTQISKESLECVELRLDSFDSLNFSQLQQFVKTSFTPVLFTLRNKAHGGFYTQSEDVREVLLDQLFQMGPSIVDLEWDMREEFINQMKKKYPDVRIILSYHDFGMTDVDLEKIYEKMCQYDVFQYKIALMPRSAAEALQMLTLAKKYPKLSVICMGEEMEFTRVLGKVFGNSLHYACHHMQAKTALGQLPIDQLKELYHFDQISEKSAIYGVIGDPVAHSLGPAYHNAIFAKEQMDAVYVKMGVTQDTLGAFLEVAKSTNIQGLSVTMPLKESIIPFLDEMDFTAKEIGAVNTLKFDKGRILGVNTDGKGALDAIEKRFSIFGKKLVLIGAGGTSRSIAFEALQKGADVMIVNRNKERAERLAKRFGCHFGSLEEIWKNYDALINCTSSSMPIAKEAIQEGSLVMEVSYQFEKSPFLQSATERNCTVIEGKEMFYHQAARQSAFWLCRS